MSGGFLKRYWFLVVLLCLIPVGLWAPGPGLYIKEQGHIIPVFVGLMLGLSGFSMDTSSLVRQAFKWRAIVPVLASMSLTASTDILAHAFSAADWSLFGVPPAEDALISQLRGLATLWEYQLTLTIFVLTFFTQQAYAHYRSVYFCARAIQGRINDVCLLLAVGATRGEVEGATSTYSDDGAALVELCARLIRLCHTFFWATTPTTSDGVGDGGLVDGDGPTDLEPSERGQAGPERLSPQGLRSRVAAGQLTANERTALRKTGLPPSQYWCVLLEWVGQYALRASTTRRSATLPVLKRDCCGS